MSKKVISMMGSNSNQLQINT